MNYPDCPSTSMCMPASELQRLGQTDAVRLTLGLQGPTPVLVQPGRCKGMMSSGQRHPQSTSHHACTIMQEVPLTQTAHCTKPGVRGC